MPTARDIALRMIEAYRTGVGLAPVRGEVNGVPAAYQVQQEAVAAWRQQGRRLAGAKIGLTAKAVQEQLGVGEPDFGMLFADMILKNGATVTRDAVMQPRVEAEIAFVMKRDLAGSHITPEAGDSRNRLRSSRPSRSAAVVSPTGTSISRTRSPTTPPRVSWSRAMCGASRCSTSLPGSPWRSAITTCWRAKGRGTACLGNPAIAVAWLAEALTRFGDKLRAGDLVMSGALARMVPVEPGSRIVAKFAGWDSVSVMFAI